MRVSQEVMAVLDRAHCTGNALSLTALGQLDRKLYADTNKVLEAAGGKWNRKARSHLFEGPAAEAVEPIILTGEVVSVRQELQQFYTPPDLAARVITEAQIEPGMTVLEPSAGLGALALPAAAAGGRVTCYELDPRSADALVKANASARARLDMVLSLDFLGGTPCAVYDRVVMNPPFARGQDIQHLIHARQFLKPGGRLVAIMSAGLLFRRGDAATLREQIETMGGTITPLPADSFKASGTSVNTCLVVVDMPERSAT